MMSNTTMKFSARALILSIVAITSVATAFAPSPAHLQPALFGGALREMPQGLTGTLRGRVERSASFTLGDSGDTVSRKPVGHRSFGWTERSDAANAAGAIRSRAQSKPDWSKLFARPEPVPAQGRPLVGLSRSCAGLAEGSCGSSPIFFGMVGLCSVFAPVFAMESVFAWGVGRVMYWWSMRGADVSQRLPAGFVAYMSLFLLVGGLSFMNGLKAISLLTVV